MSQRREAVDEAYAGDIIGFTILAACSWANITDGPAAIHRPALLRPDIS